MGGLAIEPGHGLASAITRAAEPARTERNGNGTEIRRSCAGDRMAKAERVFRFDGTERKRHALFLCLLLYIQQTKTTDNHAYPTELTYLH